MAKNFDRAAIIKSKNGMGLLWRLPLGTEVDPDPTTPLPEIAECLGTISDGGVTLSESADGGNTVPDSDGDNVRVTAGSVSRTLNATFWEIDTRATMEMFYHPSDIEADADGKVTGYNESGRTPAPCMLVMEFETDTDRIGRRVYHNVSFASRGDEVINYQNVVGREITLNVNRDLTSGFYYQTRVADRV